MEGAYRRHGQRLVRRICTAREIVSVTRDPSPARALAGLFALKEAVMKALGTGMRGVSWKEIETSGTTEGPIRELVSGRALAVALQRGVARFYLGSANTADLVVGAVVFSSTEERSDELDLAALLCKAVGKAQ
jgi:holo-[acyl-carrier protein] synthase